MDDDVPAPVEQAVLDDLRNRLRAYHRIPLTGVSGWDRGTEPDYLSDLIVSWAEDYDWRVHEERIRALPWVRTRRARLGTSGPRTRTRPSPFCCTAGRTRCSATTGCCRC